MMIIYIIQVQDPVIHLEVDEALEQSAIILAFKFPAVTQFADVLLITDQQRRIFN